MLYLAVSSDNVAPDEGVVLHGAAGIAAARRGRLYNLELRPARIKARSGEEGTHIGIDAKARAFRLRFLLGLAHGAVIRARDSKGALERLVFLHNRHRFRRGCDAGGFHRRPRSLHFSQSPPAPRAPEERGDATRSKGWGARVSRAGKRISTGLPNQLSQRNFFRVQYCGVALFTSV